jgi:hypothetical protein
MAGKPTVTLTLAGDAKDLLKAGKDAESSIDGVGKKAQESGKEAKKGFDTGTFSAVALADAVSNAGDTIGSIQAAFRMGSEQAQRLARAQLDVSQASADVRQAHLDQKQATLDLAQAQGDLRQSARDAAQAQIDLKQSSQDAAQAQLDAKQANLDAENAQKAYNDAVKQYGPNSTEAKQAAIDLEQAQLDVQQSQQDVTQAQEDGKQAQEDATQAARDGTQAQLDAKQALEDGKQAQIDAKSALLDLKDAQQEATDASGWRGWLDVVGQVLPGLVAVAVGIGPVTEAAKGLALMMTTTVIPAVWSFTAALLANPITWVVLAIAALVAAFVWLWNNVEGFRNFWKGIWHDITSQVSGAIDWIKGAWSGMLSFFSGLVTSIGNIFSGIGSAISGAFKGAINWVIGVLNHVIDFFNKIVYGINLVNPFDDIPNIPHIPKMHTGGVVPGMPGTEVPIMAMAGEHVSTSSQGGGTVTFAGNLDGAIQKLIMGWIRTGEIRIGA